MKRNQRHEQALHQAQHEYEEAKRAFAEAERTPTADPADHQMAVHFARKRMTAAAEHLEWLRSRT
ncbi:MAG: hypothetical protein ACLPTF_16625 [Steroidobacteraceae bacterium]